MKLLSLLLRISILTHKNYSNSDPALSWLTFGTALTACLLLPLAALRGKWVEGHSGWQGGAMGGYLFNNSKMQMTAYTEGLLY